MKEEDLELFPSGLRKTILMGFVFVLIFFGGFMGWASFVPLEGGAIAVGSLRVDSHTKTIQHLDGGIVKDILVSDGDLVAAGDVLIRLDDTKVKGELDLLTNQLARALLAQSRLIAERDHMQYFTITDEVKGLITDETALNGLVSNQRKIFNGRNIYAKQQKLLTNQQIMQLHQEIEGIQAEHDAYKERFVSISDQVSEKQKLFDKGYINNNQLLEMKRDMADYKGQQQKSAAMKIKSEQAITEANLRLSDIQASLWNEIVEELSELQGTIDDLKENKIVVEETYRRLEIKSQASGRIVNQSIYASGAVISPGSPIMQVVPQDERLIIDARIEPIDIDVVHPGLDVKVTLSAFNQDDVSTLDGLIETVSADAIVDEQTGASYYSAQVTITNVPENLTLYPGMPAEMLIVTGERTTLSYLVDPIMRKFNRAIREN